MNNTTLILTLATAAILSLGCVGLTANTVQQKMVTQADHTNGNGAAERQITLIYGDVPVTLAADTFQMPVNLAILAN